ncbi:syntaxin 13 [Lycorma delicatula]|uniref:syntaxin 13 n=1 Tax=Lycorma delicatula TaxID=130591 RepID=UPI003F512A2C
MAEGFSGSGGSQSYGSITSQNEPLPNVSISGFGQSNSQVSFLCDNVTTNIYTINSSWKQLQQAMKIIGTNKDNQGVRDKVHVTQLSTNEIIGQTTRDLQSLTALIRRPPSDKKQKLQVDRLTNLFKEAVQTYSSVQKQVVDKMKFSLLPSEIALQSESNEQMINVDDDQKLLTSQRQAVHDLEFEHSMLREREVRMKKIEADVIDVNQIMRELGALIHQQAEPINLIENQIENVHSSVESAEQELVKAAQYQNKRRRRTVCLLLIAAVALLTIIGMLYLALRVTMGWYACCSSHNWIETNSLYLLMSTTAFSKSRRLTKIIKDEKYDELLII